MNQTLRGHIRRLSTILAFCLWCTSSMSSQTLTNKGAFIYISPKAVFSCHGTFNINSAGMVVVEDSAKFTVSGTLNVSNGSVSLNKAATAVVTQDLITGGVCGTPSGVVMRNGTGMLTVQGILNNKGLVTNSSLIRIWRDLYNDGELNNQRGSMIDVGP